MCKLTVYLPIPGTPAARKIALGAGVVGTQVESGYVLADYENNAHGALALQRWESRVMAAAVRHRANGPSTARSVFKVADLRAVGHCDALTGDIEILPGCEEDEALMRWRTVECCSPTKLPEQRSWETFRPKPMMAKRPRIRRWDDRM